MQIKLSGLPTGIVVVRLACVHASLRTRHRVDYIMDDVCLGACVSEAQCWRCPAPSQNHHIAPHRHCTPKHILGTIAEHWMHLANILFIHIVHKWYAVHYIFIRFSVGCHTHKVRQVSSLQRIGLSFMSLPLTRSRVPRVGAFGWRHDLALIGCEHHKVLRPTCTIFVCGMSAVRKWRGMSCPVTMMTALLWLLLWLHEERIERAN